MPTAEEIIELLGMKPMPGEGGYYVEAYRSDEKLADVCLPQRYDGSKSTGTAILYLLTCDMFSVLHRLRSDEIFHFYLGDTVVMLLLYGDGSGEVVELGADITKGRRVQVVVPRGTWQGGFVKQGGRFALMGTTVAPGFDFDDFEPADRERLLREYPDYRDLIARLTPTLSP